MHYPPSLLTLVQPFGLVLSLSCCIACSPPQNSLTDPEDSITFGRGGGVVGTEKAHVLRSNGQLLVINSLVSDTVLLTTTNPETVREVFEQLQSLPLDSLDVNHPGNLYYFIRYHDGEAVWGAADYDPPADIRQLYDTLQSLIPLKTRP